MANYIHDNCWVTNSNPIKWRDSNITHNKIHLGFRILEIQDSYWMKCHKLSDYNDLSTRWVSLSKVVALVTLNINER